MIQKEPRKKQKEKAEEKAEEKELIEKTKKISIKEASASAVSDGVGMRYITPFALKLGATNLHIGFLTSLSSLLGNFSQLFTPKLIERVPRKKLLFFCALVQAIMWLFVMFVGALFFLFHIDSKIAPTVLVIIYTILIAAGAFMTPAWNSWMKDIVKEKAGAYFGKRNKIAGFIAVISMLAAGFVLDYFAKTKIFIGFFLLFALAFFARLISSLLLLKKYEPKLIHEKGYYFSFFQFIKYAPKSNYGKFAIFVSLIQLTTAIASPFFSVYMLKHLGFSYTRWIIVIIASSFVALMLMPMWGKFADRYGNIKAIKITAFLVPLVPLLWLASPLLPRQYLLFYLILVEMFSGAAWAGFNLASSNFVYDAVTRQRMALCVAYSNFLNGIGVFIGATLGGLISSIPFSIFGFESILIVFFISGIARFATAFLMVPKIKEVREVERFGIKEAKEKLMLGITKFGKIFSTTSD